jgi:hypothetical protein
MATVHEDGGKRVMFVKGASDRLLPLCKTQVASDDLSKTAPLDAAFWHKVQEGYSAHGLRVLMLCRWAVGFWGWCRVSGDAGFWRVVRAGACDGTWGRHRRNTCHAQLTPRLSSLLPAARALPAPSCPRPRRSPT